MKVGSQSGFSLVELSIVVLVTVFLMGIGLVTTFTGLNTRSLESATIQVIGDIRKVQNLAVVRGEEARMTLASDLAANEHGYRIFVQSATNPLEELPLLDGVRLDTADLGRTLRFSPLGTPQSTSTLRVLALPPNPYYVILRSWDGTETRRIAIQSATGRVTIQ